MYVAITCCVPDIQLDSMLFAIDCHVNDFTEVREHDCTFLIILRLKMAFHERIDYARFSHLTVAHENYFGSFDFILIVVNSEIWIVWPLVMRRLSWVSSFLSADYFLASTTSSLLPCFNHLRTKF